MGLSFSNIHVRMERSLDEALAGHIAEILMRGADAEPVADASEADVMVRVCAGKDSPWVTVLADSIDDDLEEQLLKTRALSEALEARTLAIACSDSDYLCLNLVDAKTKTDIWAAQEQSRRVEGVCEGRCALCADAPRVLRFCGGRAARPCGRAGAARGAGALYGGRNSGGRAVFSVWL